MGFVQFSHPFDRRDKFWVVFKRQPPFVDIGDWRLDHNRSLRHISRVSSGAVPLHLLNAARFSSFLRESFCFLQSATVCGASGGIGSEALQRTCQGAEGAGGDFARSAWLGTNNVGAKVI